MSIAAQERRESGALERLGGRIVRHSAIYSVAVVGGLILAVGQIAVLTRLMTQAEFGRLAILFIYSGLLALVCNLGVVQGTLISAFQGGDEEDVDDEHKPPPEGDNRRLIGTGMTVALIIGIVLTACSALAAPALSWVLLGVRDEGAAVVTATAYGALSSVWRLMSVIPRFEKRPFVYVALAIGRGVLILGGAVALVAAGYGLTGAVAGLLAGKVVAILIATTISRHRFRLALSREDAWRLARRGAPFIGISLSYYLARTADLYVLSRYSADTNVALYRVGGRLAAVSSVALSVTLYAWGPLNRGPIAVALKERGAIDVARGLLVTYFVFLATWVTVSLLVWADVVVRVASSSYTDAATIIPLMGVAAAAGGLLTIVYRMGRVERKLRAYRRIGWFSAVLTVVASVVLIPRYGVYGACAAAIAAPAIGAAIMLFLSQRSEQPLQLSWSRIGPCLVVGALCAVGGLAAHELGGVREVAADVLLTLAFPLGLIATGAVPVAEARRLLAFVTPGRGRGDRRDLRAGLSALDAPDRGLVESLAVRREHPQDAADRLATSRDELLERFVAILRRIGGVGEPTPIDARIGAYLLSRAAPTRRDVDGHMLSLNQHAVPLELDRLNELLGELRRLPRATWR